jgi:hypothetical protein
MIIERENCTGISHDFLRPKLEEKAPSTIGAQRSFNENGQNTKLNRNVIPMIR